MDPHGTAYNYMAGDDFPKDITVLSSTSMMVDENFQRTDIADGLYNHHNAFYNLNHKPKSLLQCGSGSPIPPAKAAVFMAGATETGEEQFAIPNGSFKSGFYIGQKDMVLFGVDMVNYGKKSRNVYSVNEIEFVYGKVPGMLPAEHQIIDIGTCSTDLHGDKVHAPKGQSKFSLQSKEITMALDGYFLHVRGHMHGRFS